MRDLQFSEEGMLVLHDGPGLALFAVDVVHDQPRGIVAGRKLRNVNAAICQRVIADDLIYLGDLHAVAIENLD